MNIKTRLYEFGWFLHTKICIIGPYTWVQLTFLPNTSANQCQLDIPMNKRLGFFCSPS
jgi:hypothetical protein